jgi:2-amino-4-hydroxy-6-hydroxymethyldihydropteridine diphosphokinase
MAQCLLGIGANLGDPPRQIAEAVQSLSHCADVQLLAVSSLWTSTAIGGSAVQPQYVNAAALIETQLSPAQLLAKTQAIEKTLGRIASARWVARPIDIDLVLYDDLVIRQANLQIPHPWMVARRFVLGPANEIAPEFRHPILGWTIAQLWRHLDSAAPRFVLLGCSDDDSIQAIAEQAMLSRVHDPVGKQAEPNSTASVDPLHRQLEWLKRRDERLRACGWNEASETRPLLSDFWIDQCLLSAKAVLSAKEYQTFEQEFNHVAERIEPPKLVILAIQPHAQDDLRIQAELELAGLRQRTIDLGVAPFVEVESTPRDDFVREAAGAIVAMS